MKLELLVTTMHQHGFEKYHSMNLQTPAVIANQADRNEIVEQTIRGQRVVLVTTDTRGLSRNRNIALAHATGDILMFADDDIVFYDDYEALVMSEFEKHPEADAIKFHINQVGSRKTLNPPVRQFKRATRCNITPYGFLGGAVKRKVFEQNSLRFDENFGTGTENYCGEDTIFLLDLLKKNIRLYLSPVTIGDIDQSVSTWFEGHNEKYFTISGKVLARIYPALSYLLVVRSAWKAWRSKKSKLSLWGILKAYYTGVIQQNHH